MEPAEIHSIADWLYRARLEVGVVADCPEPDAAWSENVGYAVQEKLHDILAQAGMGQLAGYKLGCTSSLMQERLNIPNPAYGGIMAANVHGDGARFRASEFRNVGVECEIAVWIGDDLPLTDAPFDRETVHDHVAACSVAMELVDNRYGDIATTPTGLMIADDFFHAACVVGPSIEDWRTFDFAQIAGSLSINGDVVGSGLGRDVMGHPLEALAWLANRLAERGHSLKCGQLVLTGAIVPPFWIESCPAEVSAEIDRLGRLAASLA